MPLLGVNSKIVGVKVSCDYANSSLFWIADGYHRSIGFSNLIAYRGFDGSLIAVRLSDATEKAINVSQNLGMIYGAPYKSIERVDNDAVYYI